MSALPREPALPELDLSRDAFLFDVDGTLLDIAPRPEDVVVPESLRDNLGKLRARCGGAVALISGRSFSIIDRLFEPLKLAVIGCHGAEMRLDPDGPCKQYAQPVPDDVRKAFADLGGLDPRIVLEDKTYTLAFHYRAAMDREAELLTMARARLRPFEPQFTLLHGKAIIEIKSAAFDKGKALEKLMHVAPFEGRRPLFCGDDTTDEDAFAALTEFGGTGVSIGRVMAGAQFMLASPRALRDWIADLATEKGKES